jgi:hypothetical protein
MLECGMADTERMDEVLRRMLNTPPESHKPLRERMAEKRREPSPGYSSHREP